mmetsp:Transcript_51206/g.158646  ORF Transcript_51206/g.158646 Transcript_51206/m.158646 type:complete len:258 (+) Transcript_51206:1098-1871(+)
MPGPRGGLRGALHQLVDSRLHGRREPRRLRHGRRGLGAGRRVPRDHLAGRDHVRAHGWAADGGAIHVRLPHRQVCGGHLHRRHLRLRDQASGLPLLARARRGRLPQVRRGRHGPGAGGRGLRGAHHRRTLGPHEGHGLQRRPPHQVLEARQQDHRRVRPQKPDHPAPGEGVEGKPVHQQRQQGLLLSAARARRAQPLRAGRLHGLPRGEGYAGQGGPRDVPKARHQAHLGRGGGSLGGHDHQEVLHRPHRRVRALRG